MSLNPEIFQQLVAQSSDIVVATNRQGVVIYYNDGAARILGYHSDEILGHFVVELYPSLDEARRVMAAMRSDKIGSAGSIDTFQTMFVSKSGERIPVAISGTILRDAAKQEVGTIGFAKDLREILRRDQLATLGEVAIGLSHEVNTPLSVILNQIELLEQDVETLAGEKDCSVPLERVDSIRREVGRLSDIIDRLSEMVETERYETITYVGPAKMLDLRHKVEYSKSKDPRLKGLRILVVDDDLGICETLRELLEHQGCSVVTAHDGQEALAQLRKTKFDVLLSDVAMPKMDGFELYCAAEKEFPGLPVLMMTGFYYDKDHVIKRSRFRGLRGVVFKKPVDPERLQQVILESVYGSADNASPFCVCDPAGQES